MFASSSSTPESVQTITTPELETVELVSTDVTGIPIVIGQQRSTPYSGSVLVIGRVHPAGYDDAGNFGPSVTPSDTDFKVFYLETVTTGIRDLSASTLVQDATPETVVFTVAIIRQSEDITRAYADANTARSALRSFKGKARAVAINAHLNGDFCMDGMNGAFRELEIEEYAPTFDVSIRVTVTATVTADSEEDAQQILRDALTVDDDDEISNSDIDW